MYKSIMRCNREVRYKMVSSLQIVSLLDMFTPQRNFETFQDIYLVMEFMDANLHYAIRCGSIATHDQLSFLVYQLLCGLKHLNSASIIHRVFSDIFCSHINIDQI